MEAGSATPTAIVDSGKSLKFIFNWSAFRIFVTEIHTYIDTVPNNIFYLRRYSLNCDILIPYLHLQWGGLSWAILSDHNLKRIWPHISR